VVAKLFGDLGGPVGEVEALCGPAGQLLHDPLGQRPGLFEGGIRRGEMARAPLEPGEPRLDPIASLAGIPMQSRVGALPAREPEVLLPVRAGLLVAIPGEVIPPQLEQERPLAVDAAGQVGPCLRVMGPGADQLGVIALRFAIGLDRLGRGAATSIRVARVRARRARWRR
jgi:hypothetical protein